MVFQKNLHAVKNQGFLKNLQGIFSCEKPYRVGFVICVGEEPLFLRVYNMISLISSTNVSY
jgi:hypothetical protein